MRWDKIFPDKDEQYSQASLVLMKVPVYPFLSSFCENQGKAGSLASIVETCIQTVAEKLGECLKCFCFGHNYIVNEPVVWKM